MRGLTTAVGGNFPNVISRMTPPATPVIVERITMPTISDLCSIALNAPVTAKAIVPKRSKIWTSIIIDRFGSATNLLCCICLILNRTFKL